MQTQTILIAAAGLAAVLLLAKKPGASTTRATVPWYAASREQQSAVERAVADQWRATFSVLDKTDPDFWV